MHKVHDVDPHLDHKNMPGWLLVIIVVFCLSLVIALCFYSEHVRRKVFFLIIRI